MLETRSLPSGGWRHDFENQAGPYLGDSLSMGRAMLNVAVTFAELESLRQMFDEFKRQFE